jgi:hypothetical protein
MSAVAALVGVFMLIFSLVSFSHVEAAPGPAVAFVVVWVMAVIGGIIYHLVNATRPGGVPTQIIESDSDSDVSGSTADRLQELEDLRSRKLISEMEYQTKRQKVLNEL